MYMCVYINAPGTHAGLGHKTGAPGNTAVRLCARTLESRNAGPPISARCRIIISIIPDPSYRAGINSRPPVRKREYSRKTRTGESVGREGRTDDEEEGRAAATARARRDRGSLREERGEEGRRLISARWRWRAIDTLVCPYVGPIHFLYEV